MLVAMVSLNLHPIFVFCLGALLGIIITKVKEKLGLIIQLEKKTEQARQDQAS
ncbi:hypothetical protein SFC52_08750 [Niallia circulans]